MDHRTAMCAGYSVGIKEAIRRAQKTIAEYRPEEPGELWETTVRRYRKALDKVLKDLDDGNPFDLEM